MGAFPSPVRRLQAERGVRAPIVQRPSPRPRPSWAANRLPISCCGRPKGDKVGACEVGAPMRPLHPDTWLIPLLLPIFLIGFFPLLILGVVGFLGLGVLGLLVLFIAIGDEINATTVFSRHVVTRDFLPTGERAA